MKVSLIATGLLPLLFQPTISEFALAAVESPVQEQVELAEPTTEEVHEEGLGEAVEDGDLSVEQLVPRRSSAGSKSASLRGSKKNGLIAGIAGAAMLSALVMAGIFGLSRLSKRQVPEEVRDIVDSVVSQEGEKSAPAPASSEASEAQAPASQTAAQTKPLSKKQVGILVRYGKQMLGVSGALTIAALGYYLANGGAAELGNLLNEYAAYLGLSNGTVFGPEPAPPVSPALKYSNESIGFPQGN